MDGIANAHDFNSSFTRWIVTITLKMDNPIPAGRRKARGILNCRSEAILRLELNFLEGFDVAI